ncbi:hypothetical protein GCM10011415_27610 [Salipiger pallidus]|uniref:Uncharacterized protein n=1 Tax=Salipiger pallidus TaxID=1775170 RepID=A0A8J3EHA1_9RHOB|nr:hypothetical protein GCM10011415_27610 [Salipiger pallidus]
MILGGPNVTTETFFWKDRVSMEKLSSIFHLREMLRQLERDVGLDELTRFERDVLLVAHGLCRTPGEIIRSEQIREHPLVRHSGQATFYRAIRSLMERGLLERAGSSKAKTYVVRSDLVGVPLPLSDKP